MKFLHYTSISLLFLAVQGFAARPVDLSHQNINYLNSFTMPATLAAANYNSSGIIEVNKSIDFNQTAHIRIKQTYAGFPVWNGDAVIHIRNAGKSASLLDASKKNATMNGIIYEELHEDLHATPALVFEPMQAQKALQVAIKNFQELSQVSTDAKHKRSKLIVYVDENNKAHWAFHVRFALEQNDHLYQPNYLIDALTFNIYQQWDNVKTLDDVKGGGVGGNPKLGRLVYDGLPGHLPALDLQRDAPSGICFMQNDNLFVADFTTRKIFSYACYQPDWNHNKVYWNKSTSDAVNGGYSPSTDSFYAGNLVQTMYKQLYGIDVLASHGKPMPLRILTHITMDNAEWIDGPNYIKIGDGEKKFYPLASIGVIAHEASHGFTSQHSNLIYMGQPGGINESFSDMAAQVVEHYALGHNNWQIGYEIVKENNSALRYMDYPSKDCQNAEPGKECSIDVAQDYSVGMNVHKSSGVYNRAFYLLATSPGWDVYKAFGVMIQANSYYWTHTSNFRQSACGVIHAAEDYKYDTTAVIDAFNKVGVDVSEC